MRRRAQGRSSPPGQRGPRSRQAASSQPVGTSILWGRSAGTSRSGHLPLPGRRGQPVAHEGGEGQARRQVRAWATHVGHVALPGRALPQRGRDPLHGLGVGEAHDPLVGGVPEGVALRGDLSRDGPERLRPLRGVEDRALVEQLLQRQHPLPAGEAFGHDRAPSPSRPPVGGAATAPRCPGRQRRSAGVRSRRASGRGRRRERRARSPPAARQSPWRRSRPPARATRDGRAPPPARRAPRPPSPGRTTPPGWPGGRASSRGPLRSRPPRGQAMAAARTWWRRPRS